MATFYEFNVTLLDVEPRIWRAFALRNTATFHDLHEAIQDACGWEDYHLYRFHVTRNGPVIAGIPDDSGFEEPDPDAADIKPKSYFRDKPDRCYYLYDFGDDWWHEVELTKVSKLADRRKRFLLGGALSFPPEDCGSTHGYERCVAAVTGKWTAALEAEIRQEELIEWLGDWKPDGFQLEQACTEFDR